MPTKKRAITIYDVARESGVSISTVSRVLNGKGDVALETNEKVRCVVKELGYASSLAARGMRSHRTNVIGLIMPDAASPYSLEVLRGVNRGIAQLDYHLIVYTPGDIRKRGTADQERQYARLLNGSITDGLIVVTPAATDFSTDAPLLVIDPNNQSPDGPAIMCTNRAGALAAMSYLTHLGHRRIGHITGRSDLVSASDRLEGYKDGLSAAGIPVDPDLIQVGDYETETAKARARTLLALKDPPTAIFASNDMSAQGVYQAAHAMGLRIPQDLSVVGFDNLPEAALFDPPLTTVDQFILEMGTLATEMIARLLRGEPLEKDLVTIPTQLVIRDSCLPLARLVSEQA
jgi:LacI family transcriptional regulator